MTDRGMPEFSSGISVAVVFQMNHLAWPSISTKFRLRDQRKCVYNGRSTRYRVGSAMKTLSGKAGSSGSGLGP